MSSQNNAFKYKHKNLHPLQKFTSSVLRQHGYHFLFTKLYITYHLQISSLRKYIGLHITPNPHEKDLDMAQPGDLSNHLGGLDWGDSNNSVRKKVIKQ